MSKYSNGGALRRSKTKWELDAIQATKLRNRVLEDALDGNTAAARLVFEYTHVKPEQTLEVNHFNRVEWDVTHILPSEAVAAATALTGPTLQRLGSGTPEWEDGVVCEPSDPEGATGPED